MSIPENLYNQFVVIQGRWIHRNMIATNEPDSVTLHDGRVFTR